MSVIIIAEAGVNHNGSLKTARQLIAAAAAAGVDYVKFQTFRADRMVSKSADKADYQKTGTGKPQESQLDMLRRLELSPEDHHVLLAHCREKNVRFLSTAFDPESIDFLHTLDMDLWKIPSGEITNYPYLKKVAGYGKPVVLSTGMSEINEIEDALQVLTANGTPKERITLLHCNTEYPTPMEDVNLRAMQEMARRFGVNTGYSDHTLGLEIPVAAVALGATVIEKHFTLDRNLEGPDHRASLEPEELRSMVRMIRHVEQALGSGIKTPSASEIKNKDIARKSIVAACRIRKGECFTEDNLTVKRPGGGISPMLWECTIGKTAERDYAPDEMIES